jgi:hypothetical protein
MRTVLKLAGLVVLVCICFAFLAPSVDLPETALRAYRAAILLMLLLVASATLLAAVLPSTRPRAKQSAAPADSSLAGVPSPSYLCTNVQHPMIC